jgi:anaerobic ribonucleoside-triphosphate reductase activating protein
MKVWIRRVDESMGTDTDGEGISLNIFFAGCSKQPKCPKCHNPELWQTTTNDEVHISWLYKKLEEAAANGLITHVVFVGGEPLDQPIAVYLAALKAKELGLTTWLYTWHTYNNIPTNIKDVVNVVVAGDYRDELKTGGFPGSSNQTVTRRKV